MPFGRPRALFFVTILQSFLGCHFKANLCQKWVENGVEILEARQSSTEAIFPIMKGPVGLARQKLVEFCFIGL